MRPLYFFFLIFIIILSFFPAFAEKPSSSSFATLQGRYIPQPTPESSYHLELELLIQGIYCYDLPMFDPQWRKKNSEILTSELFKQTAAEVNKPFKAFAKGKYAVIYYPENRELGPVFFYKDKNGWVIDWTATTNKVFYDNVNWVVLEGKYPYFSLLSQLFDMERVEVAKGVWGYRIKKDSSLKPVDRK